MGLGICYSKHDPGHLRNQQVSLTPPLSTHTNGQVFRPPSERWSPPWTHCWHEAKEKLPCQVPICYYELTPLCPTILCHNCPLSAKLKHKGTWPSFFLWSSLKKDLKICCLKFSRQVCELFPWSNFCFRCPTISSAAATRGIHPPLQTSVELTEAFMHNFQGHDHLAYFSPQTYWSTPVLCQH